MRYVLVPLVCILLPVCASASLLGPSDYNECIIEGMKGVQSDVAARAVRQACRSQFPENTKKEKVPKKCSSIPKYAAQKEQVAAPLSGSKTGGITVELLEQWDAEIGPDIAPIPRLNPAYTKCIQECENASFYSKHFGECKPQQKTETAEAENLPFEAFKKLSGSTLAGPYGCLSGNIYNGNQDWVVSKVSISIGETGWFKKSIEAINNMHDTSDSLPEVDEYKLEITIPPHTSKYFSIPISRTPGVPFDWSISEAWGHMQPSRQ